MKLTYTLIINGETITTRSTKKAYAAYDKAINNKQTVEKFVDDKGHNIADR